MNNRSKEPSEDVAGVYLFEGMKVTVSVVDGNVIAVNEKGVQLPPMEVVLHGRKIEKGC